VSVTSCYAADGAHRVQQRATTDMNCSEKIEVTSESAQGSYRAQGCGRTLRYKCSEVRRNPNDTFGETQCEPVTE
jgi:hypothetical protein